MPFPLQEKLSELQTQGDADLSQLYQLKDILEAMNKKYGYTEAVQAVERGFELFKLQLIQKYAGIFQQTKDHYQVADHPEVVSSFGVIQAIEEEQKTKIDASEH